MSAGRQHQAGGAAALPVLAGAMAALVAGCTDIRRTAPERTANEQLLISTAADHAADRMDFDIPESSKVYIDTRFFKSYDKPYVISVLRTSVAEHDVALVSEKEQADYIVEIRSGALSINRRSDYIGLGGFSVPTPSTVPVQLPQANLYADNDRTGLAKFSASVYRAEDGLLASVVGPVYGVAWIDQDAILGVGWRNTNTLPEDDASDMRPENMGASQSSLIDFVPP